MLNPLTLQALFELSMLWGATAIVLTLIIAVTALTYYDAKVKAQERQEERQYEFEKEMRKLELGLDDDDDIVTGV